jgi:hypothetical protein
VYGPAPGSSNPSISNSNSGNVWVVCETWSTVAALSKVYAFRVDVSGAIPAGVVREVTPASGAYDQPAASSRRSDGRSLVAWRSNGVDSDIEVALLDPDLWVMDLTELWAVELNGHQNQDQRGPAIDCDGSRFLVAYSESVAGSATDFDIRLTELYFHFPGSSSAVLGSDVVTATAPATTGAESRPALAAFAGTGGASRFYAFAWDRELAPSDHNVLGGYYLGAGGGLIAPYCFGDGSGTACPCSNVGGAGRGCPHSANALGARLDWSGASDMRSDTLVLQAVDMPASTTCLFFQGSSTAGGGLGTVFGDGLRCATTAVIRLGAKPVSGGAASYPQGGDLPVSVRGLLPQTGGARYYQVWFRNAATFCTADTFNTTNGLFVVWIP